MRVGKRLMVVVGVLCGSVLVVSGQVAWGFSPYQDVPADHYAAQHIAALSDAGVFEGTDCGGGLFCPDAPILRSTMAVWMVRILDGGAAPPAATGDRFDDVAVGDRWAAYIERFAELGVTAGCGDGTRFCGDEATSRGQMATFLVRAFSLDEASSFGFGDTVGSAHEASIDALAAAGVTKGCAAGPARFCPSEVTSRSQMAAFIGRVLDLGNSALVDRFAVLMLDRANRLRHSDAALVWDEGLSSVAQAKAQAMAEARNWQPDFNLWSRVVNDWDLVAVGGSVATDENTAETHVIPAISDWLTNPKGAALLVCPGCTHLGSGIATVGDWTYATLLIAGRIPEQDLATAEAQMAGLVNELREDLGLRPLRYEPTIAAGARRWSLTMATYWRLQHNLVFDSHYPPGHVLAGENIARERYVIPLSDAIQKAFDGLKTSPGHYNNMTIPALTHQGIGVVVKGDRVWITQNFAAYPDGSPPQSLP